MDEVKTEKFGDEVVAAGKEILNGARELGIALAAGTSSNLQLFLSCIYYGRDGSVAVLQLAYKALSCSKFCLKLTRWFFSLRALMQCCSR